MNDAAKWLRWRMNTLDYRIRNGLRFSLSYREKPESKDALFEERLGAEALQAHEAVLRQRYKLDALAAASGRLRYLEVLTYLDHLDFLRTQAGLSLPETSETLSWLDVGAKNWSYAPALCHFIVEQRPDFRLDGIEVDPYRRYTDLRSRADYARVYTASYPQAHYHHADILGWRGGPYHVISHFLPFVLPEPCLAWGLPRHLFQPIEQLRHLTELLQPGGILLITNQGEWERDAQQALLDGIGQKSQMLLEWSGEFPAGFIEFRFQRFGWLLRKASA